MRPKQVAQGGTVNMSAERDPGPRARWQHVMRDPFLLGTILQRVAGGESLRDIGRAWKVPQAELRDWVHAEGRRLVHEAAVAHYGAPMTAVPSGMPTTPTEPTNGDQGPTI